ncbi:MAG: DedA family protein [Candidatus Uhrbacteria bacterium]|nr:DedA family protein [Candidatus Uhrbacteria bacterium]
MDFFSFDLISFIKAAGTIGVSAIVFAESGLLIGFFLPGDSLLFTAGFLASQGWLPIIPLVLACFAGAAIGDSVGYAFGKRIGPRLFSKSDSFLFHKDHVTRTQRYFTKYGARTIFIARFIPIVRTFAPVLAGVGGMPYTTFVKFNILGAFAWGACIPLIGYFLGSVIPDIDKYLLPIIAGIIIISVLPPLLEIIRHRKK